MSDDTKESPPFDRDQLEAMNAKAVQNQFFTPDHVYIDLSLLKDIPLGVVYADNFNPEDPEAFTAVQERVLTFVHDYQKRRYETVDPFFNKIGYSDKKIEDLLNNKLSHDDIFMMAPTTGFFDTLIRHTFRNQNNSGPADKYVRVHAGKGKQTVTSVPITYYINTYPLTLSPKILDAMGPVFGEAFGVNIQFLNKDPSTFDERDWSGDAALPDATGSLGLHGWLSKIDCFYLNSLGCFTRSPFIIERQQALDLVGCYVFARKRFETRVMAAMMHEDFDAQIQVITAHLDILCDFQWLQNNDVRLTDDLEDVPMEDLEPQEG